MTFDELYMSMLSRAAKGEAPEIDAREDARLLDFLLHPKNYAPVWAVKDCSACESGEADCCSACLFHAIERSPDGSIIIDPARCSGCAACINACNSGTLTASRDILPALYDMKNAKGPVYALVAPSFIGQFSPGVTPGRLRSALKELGFEDMVEVALFADILTLNEALRFDRHIHSQQDFQLSSCCCPLWVALIRDSFRDIVSHLPGAVSPMIAAGRTVKALHPDAMTIFIGPCLAKKKEAREPDLAGAVDWVLTFQEIAEVFKAGDIKPESLDDIESGHASRLGRLYGRAGGVGEAVQETFKRLHPNDPIQVKVSRADGVRDCKALIKKAKAGEDDANYYEGMGCPGGCVGGPRIVVDKQIGRENVNCYADHAAFFTPPENPYVIKLLQQLGFETVSAFLDQSDMFSREL